MYWPLLKCYLGKHSFNVDFRAIGSPVAFELRFENLLADKIGIGIDVNYALTGYEYTEPDYY